MALTKEQKQEILNDLIEKMKEAKCVVFSQFHGLGVKDMTELRGQMREQGVSYKVAKKTLIKIAAKEAGYDQEIPDESLDGPIAVAFSMEDEIAAAKLVNNFAKDHDGLKLMGGLFEGKVMSMAQAKELADLPGVEELMAKFVYLLKSPIQGFHGVLNNTVSGFVRVLDAIKEKKEQEA